MAAASARSLLRIPDVVSSGNNPGNNPALDHIGKVCKRPLALANRSLALDKCRDAPHGSRSCNWGHIPIWRSLGLLTGTGLWRWTSAGPPAWQPQLQLGPHSPCAAAGASAPWSALAAQRLNRQRKINFFVICFPIW